LLPEKLSKRNVGFEYFEFVMDYFPMRGERRETFCGVESHLVSNSHLGESFFEQLIELILDLLLGLSNFLDWSDGVIFVEKLGE
jgi:hypothetical protein